MHSLLHNSTSAGHFRTRARDLGLLPRIQRARKMHPASKIIDETSQGLMQQYFEAIDGNDPRLDEPPDEATLHATHVSRRPLPLKRPMLRQPRERPQDGARPLKSRAGTAPVPSRSAAPLPMQPVASGRRAGSLRSENIQSPTHGRRSTQRAHTAAAAAGSSSGANDEGLFEDGV